jgi:hypothetical protein
MISGLMIAAAIIPVAYDNLSVLRQMSSAGQGRNRFAVSHLPAQFGAEDFSDHLPKPPISQIFC